MNGKSAIEWVTGRYAVTVDKDSQVRNYANDWRGDEDPRYIVDLVKEVVRVSVETVRIVCALTLLDESMDRKTSVSMHTNPGK